MSRVDVMKEFRMDIARAIAVFGACVAVAGCEKAADAAKTEFKTEAKEMEKTAYSFTVKNREGGFELLDFPCNQFGQQAPGTDEEIHSFCVHNYKTAFPQFAKVDVNGENAAPLFRYLTDSAGFEGFPQDGKLAPILEKMLGEADPDYAKKPSIKWNFTKFLVGKDGRVIRRFEPTAPLADVEKAIVDAMQAK